MQKKPNKIPIDKQVVHIRQIYTGWNYQTKLLDHITEIERYSSYNCAMMYYIIYLDIV